MPELVALAVPPGPAFLDALRRIWDDGDAVLPLDPHAPAPHRDRLLNALAPSAVVEADGTRHHRSGGRPVEDGDAVVIATSGTTGAPRGAVHTHAGVAAAARMTSAACGATGSDVGWLACLPLGHVGGFSVITRALLAGTGLEIHDRPDAARIDDAARRGATHVSLVPTLLGRIDPAPWRAILLGGSAVPVRRPDNTIATYGMTETFGGVVYDGLALDGVAIRIGSGPDGDSGPEGPIELRSPSLMRAYRDGTDPRTDDGWYRTGDVGEITPNGLKLITRKDRIFKLSNGEKVIPTDLEKAIELKCHYVQYAVVAGSGEEYPVALIFPNKKLLEHPDYQITPDQGCFCPRSLNELGRCLTGCLRMANDSIGQKFAKVRSAAVILDELSLEKNTLTPSMKMAPRNVMDKYRSHLQKLYGASVPVDEEVYVIELEPDGHKRHA